MNRNGSLLIVDDRGREVERYPIVYGATLLIPDGARVEEDQKLAKWDPLHLRDSDRGRRSRYVAGPERRT